MVSALLAGEDFGRAYNAGDYPGMAMAALGFVPGGRPAGRFARKLLADEASQAGKALNNLESKHAMLADAEPNADAILDTAGRGSKQTSARGGKSRNLSRSRSRRFT